MSTKDQNQSWTGNKIDRVYNNQCPFSTAHLNINFGHEVN